MSQALEKDGDYVYIYPTTTRDLLFEYDKDSVEITEACKTQYAPRTNGSFMGEVRRVPKALCESDVLWRNK